MTPRTILLSGAAASVAALVAMAGPAAAQTPSPAAPPTVMPRLVWPPPPADLGALPKPTPRFDDTVAGEGCAPAWPCRLRLFGVIDKNGGVGLKGPALTW